MFSTRLSLVVSQTAHAWVRIATVFHWARMNASELRHMTTTYHFLAYRDLPAAITIPTCEHSLEISWSPAMIQSGIFDFPCVFALWDGMKIGLSFTKAEPVTFRYF